MQRFFMNGARICSSLKEMAQQKQLLSQKIKQNFKKTWSYTLLWFLQWSDKRKAGHLIYNIPKSIDNLNNILTSGSTPCGVIFKSWHYQTWKVVSKYQRFDFNKYNFSQSLSSRSTNFYFDISKMCRYKLWILIPKKSHMK
jgi:hypothetical protein